MRWLGVVNLKAGGEGTLGERVWVVTEEGIVIAQQGVVDGVFWLCQEQILVLFYYLMQGSRTES